MFKPLGRIAAIAALAFALPALAQYPSHPIAIVVPYAAGGATDVLARIVGKKLGDILGQPVIVDNKPGAGGAIGTAFVAKAAPNGYTLLLGNTGPNAINPSVYRRDLGYDADKDFAPISLLNNVPQIFVVGAASPVKSMQELIALGRSTGKNVNIGSAGIGSVSHLSGAWLNALAGTRFDHIPYSKGAAPLIMALLSGEISVGVVNGVDATPQIKSGKLRALGITSPKRTALLPEVPTTAEGGVPGLETEMWYGLLAPAKTPKPIIDRLQKEVEKIVAEPAVKAQLLDLGSTPASSSPEQFSALIKSDIAKYARLVKLLDVKVD